MGLASKTLWMSSEVIPIHPDVSIYMKDLISISVLTSIWISISVYNFSIDAKWMYSDSFYVSFSIRFKICIKKM